MENLQAPMDKEGSYFYLNQNSREPMTEPDEMVPLWKIFDIVGADFGRMRVALASRGYQGRSLATWGMYARTVGSVFVRTYERGERVYLAMLSRVYTGSMPASGAVAVPVVQWVTAALLVGFAAAVMIASKGLS